MANQKIVSNTRTNFSLSSEDIQLEVDPDPKLNIIPIYRIAIRCVPPHPDTIIVSAGSYEEVGVETFEQIDIFAFTGQSSQELSFIPKDGASLNVQVLGQMYDLGGNFIAPQPQGEVIEGTKSFILKSGGVAVRAVGHVKVTYQVEYTQINYTYSCSDSAWVCQDAHMIVFKDKKVGTLELPPMTFEKPINEIAIYRVVSPYIAGSGRAPSNQYEQPLSWPDELNFQNDPRDLAPSIRQVTVPSPKQSAQLYRVHEVGYGIPLGNGNMSIRKEKNMAGMPLRPIRGSSSAYSFKPFCYFERLQNIPDCGPDGNPPPDSGADDCIPNGMDFESIKEEVMAKYLTENDV